MRAAGRVALRAGFALPVGDAQLMYDLSAAQVEHGALEPLQGPGGEAERGGDGGTGVHDDVMSQQSGDWRNTIGR